MLASIPIPFSRTSSRNRSPNHVPRPRNAFMLFRSAFAAAQKITTNIEHDSRHITRIIAHCWNRLSESEKQVWRDKAAAEKALHALRYPNYRFTP
ncbi:HMG-box, partial [Leucogyrophana mollusca]